MHEKLLCQLLENCGFPIENIRRCHIDIKFDATLVGKNSKSTEAGVKGTGSGAQSHRRAEQPLLSDCLLASRRFVWIETV
jgi:hypothetical protein